MTAPDISIISTSFNRRRYIGEMINSINQQRSADISIEHIIVDGGSTDGTLDLLRSFGDTITWISEPDGGQYDAANKGFRLAKGNVIGWLDADDLYLRGALKTVHSFFERHADCHWAYGKCSIIDSDGGETSKFITFYKNMLAFHYNYRVLLCENFISQPATFFRRSVFDEIGNIDTRYKLAADYDFLLRLGGRYTPGVIRECLAAFRSHPDSISAAQYREQFREELSVVAQHTTSRLIKAIHRINTIKIVAAYALLGRGKPVQSRAS